MKSNDKPDDPDHSGIDAPRADSSHILGSRYLNKRNVLRLLVLLVILIPLIDYALSL
ncbi:hypothetical protein GJ633_13180 [Halorubrum sp. CBA1125]|uniref:hypothetical protein n=1 Tax=Halorubrum sp. CBA1125 TaxID=2668072 RepID=UPI0012E94189|nr:hypothetical protein [Halorubrum sp. CBA1125]MUW15480.1 hypothetical protein [Halorubrum sp. CBA1125]